MSSDSDPCEFPEKNPPPALIDGILSASASVAVVGLSPNPDRPSFAVARYLKDQGYRIIPVRPHTGEILGEACYPDLIQVPGSIDIVDIFRKAEAVPEIVEMAIKKRAKVIWMQEGIVNNAAARRAESAGLTVVMNKCLLKEHRRWAESRKPT